MNGRACSTHFYPGLMLADAPLGPQIMDLWGWLVALILFVLIAGTILIYIKRRHDQSLLTPPRPQYWTLPELRDMLQAGKITSTEFELLKNQVLIRYLPTEETSTAEPAIAAPATDDSAPPQPAAPPPLPSAESTPQNPSEPSHLPAEDAKIPS